MYKCLFLTEIQNAFDYGFGGLVFSDTADAFLGSPDPAANGYFNLYFKAVSNVTGINGTVYTFSQH